MINFQVSLDTHGKKFCVKPWSTAVFLTHRGLLTRHRGVIGKTAVNRGFSHRVKYKPRFPTVKPRYRKLRLLKISHIPVKFIIATLNRNRLFGRQGFAWNRGLPHRGIYARNPGFWRVKECVKTKMIPCHTIYKISSNNFRNGSVTARWLRTPKFVVMGLLKDHYTAPRRTTYLDFLQSPGKENRGFRRFVLNRESQTIYSVFNNRTLPLSIKTAGFRRFF
jgi:hypothetical protein